jgi:hypothetical protein
MDNPIQCECFNWERLGHPRCRGPRACATPYVEHHPKCKHYDLAKESSAMVSELVHAMEAWGKEEDGIPGQAWEAYKRGKAWIGEFNWRDD